MSLYDYAGGDPVNFVDPTGRAKKYNPDDPSSWTLPGLDFGIWEPGTTKGQGRFRFYEGTPQHKIFNGALDYKLGVPDFSKHVVSINVGGVEIPGNVQIDLSRSRGTDDRRVWNALSDKYKVPADEIKAAFVDMDVNVHHFDMQGNMQIVPTDVNGGLAHSGPHSAMKGGWDFKAGDWGKGVKSFLVAVGLYSIAESVYAGEYDEAAMQVAEEAFVGRRAEVAGAFMDWGPKEPSMMDLSVANGSFAATIMLDIVADPSKSSEERLHGLGEVRAMMAGQNGSFDPYYLHKRTGMEPFTFTQRLGQIERALRNAGFDKNPTPGLNH
jgi:hypothetical protein